MRHFLYIIYSEKVDRYYVGITKDIETRIKRHNQGWTRSTKDRGIWELKYVEEFTDKSEAIRREKEIKRKKSRRYIERLIKKHLYEEKR